MRFHVFATDYDGTLAHHGTVSGATLAALERARATGRKLLMVTGRELPDLERVFPRLDLFDAIVAENGALIYRPATRTARALADAPPPAFVEALRARGVERISVGQVIVATWEPHETTVLETIREMGLELQVIFNKGAVMVLPSGVNKATGLRAALEELGLSPHNTVGVGDAENDHAFLSECECAVAVANALPALKDRADVVTAGDHGEGVQELIAELVDGDLARWAPRLRRHDLVLGTGPDDATLCVPPYGPPVLLAGTSGGGKSTLALSLLEQLAARGYQFCIIDPEGDYRENVGATVLGDSTHAPSLNEITEVLSRPAESVVVNLLGVKLADRPAYFEGLLPRLQELRARTGRPHWLLIDEAHHLMPESWRPTALTLPHDLSGMLLVTVHPQHVAKVLIDAVGRVIGIGAAPMETLSAFARIRGVAPPRLENGAVQPGEAVLWEPTAPAARRFRARPPQTERRRHIRKYAAGELDPDRSFFFRGPEGRLNLRAQNLQLFLQVADGVDDDTWLFHLREGHYSRWFREAIKDGGLADEAAAVEREAGLTPRESRARVRAAVESRYTAPA